MVENNLRFPGQYYDSETGLHYNYHRYYDPRTGRYLRPDPVEFPNLSLFAFITQPRKAYDDIWLYIYAQDNPVNKVDYFGLVSCNGEWRLKDWEYLLPKILRMCACYWLCRPCDGTVIWSGKKHRLPSNRGIVIHTGGDIESGDFCLCNKPGLEKDCKCEK